MPGCRSIQRVIAADLRELLPGAHPVTLILGSASAQIMEIIRLEPRRFFSQGLIQGGRRSGRVVIADSGKCTIDRGFKRCRRQYKKQRHDEGHADPVYDEVLAKVCVKNTLGSYGRYDRYSYKRNKNL